MSGAKSQITKIPAPSLGLDLDSAPAYVSPQHGLEVTNFIPGKSGRLAWSQGLNAQGAPGSPVDSQFFGAWCYDDLVVSVVAGTRVVFGVGDTAIATINNTFPQYARVRDLVYGVGQKTAPVGATPGVLAYYSMNSAGAITEMLNCPGTANRAAGAASWNDRLFVLGVTPIINWSDVGGPIADTAAQWQDDVTGLTNEIILDGGSGDYGVALARVGRALLILRRRSAWLLTGDTPSTFNVQRVAAYGCADAGTVLEYGGGVFYQSDEGLIFFNGSSFTVVSRQINALIPQLLVFGPKGTTPGGSACVLTEEYVMFMFTDGVTGTGGLQRFVLHVPTGAWALMNDSTITYAFAGRSLSRPFVISNLRVFYSAANLVRLPITGSGNPRAPGAITTAVVALGTPTNKAHLKRLLVDYRADKRNNGSPAPDLTVSIMDELGNQILAPTLLPGNDLSAVRKRFVLDIFGEVESIYLRFAVTTGMVIEIHDTWVEYDAAQPRTG